jgi:hypothetical protein
MAFRKKEVQALCKLKSRKNTRVIKPNPKPNFKAPPISYVHPPNYMQCKHCGKKIYPSFFPFCSTCLYNMMYQTFGGGDPVPEIKFSNGDSEEWTRLDITGLAKRDFDQILGILKLAVSNQDKNWDQKRKCWFVKTDLVDALMIGFQSIVNAINATRFNNPYSVIKLLDKREKLESFDEFFNSPPPMGAQKHRTKAELIKAMEHHLKTNELFITIREDIDLDSAKKLYRKAALAFHPDRNNGDGAKMSELNMIWNELQQRF